MSQLASFDAGGLERFLQTAGPIDVRRSVPALARCGAGGLPAATLAKGVETRCRQGLIGRG